MTLNTFSTHADYLCESSSSGFSDTDSVLDGFPSAAPLPGAAPLGVADANGIDNEVDSQPVATSAVSDDVATENRTGARESQSGTQPLVQSTEADYEPEESLQRGTRSGRAIRLPRNCRGEESYTVLTTETSLLHAYRTRTDRQREKLREKIMSSKKKTHQ